MAIKYEKISSRDLSVASNSSKKGAVAQRNVNKHDGSAWVITCGWIEENAEFQALHANGDLKEVRESLKTLIHKELRDKLELKGDVKWTKEDSTRNICKYISDFAKIIIANDEDGNPLYKTWLPGNDTVAGRSAIMKLALGVKPAIEKHKSTLETADKIAVNLEESDIPEAVSHTVGHLIDLMRAAKKQNVASDVLAVLNGLNTEFTALQTRAQ